MPQCLLKCQPLVQELYRSTAETVEHTALDSVNVELRERLQTWVMGGYLELQRVTWASSAAMLEKVQCLLKPRPLAERVSDNRLWSTRLCIRLQTGQT